jgi:hypothetical protein
MNSMAAIAPLPFKITGMSASGMTGLPVLNRRMLACSPWANGTEVAFEKEVSFDRVVGIFPRGRGRCKRPS